MIFANDGKAATTVTPAGGMAWYLDEGDTRKRWAFEDSLFRDEPNINGKPPFEFDLPAGSDRSLTLLSSKWEQSAVQAFMDGRGYVYATGTIYYASGHGNLCQVRYCMYIGKDGNGKFCLHHNEEPPCS